MRFIFTILSISLLIGCAENNTNFEHPDVPLPSSKLVAEKQPFSIEYISSKTTEEYTELFLKTSHIDQVSISKNDYQFRWPDYIFDQDNVPFKVLSIDIFENNSEFNLGEYEILIKITLSPGIKTHGELMLQLPVFVTPTIYQKGYPFELQLDSLDHTTGDIHLFNIKVDNNKISFQMRDNHPRPIQQIEYNFQMKTENEERIYPLFTRETHYNDAKLVELEFANPVHLPSELFITRTTASLPEWRFNLTIPIE